MDKYDDIALFDNVYSNAFADHRASSLFSSYNRMSANWTMRYWQFLILRKGSKI